MDRIKIRGGRRLSGEIPVSGAKNAALKLMGRVLADGGTADPGQHAAAGGCAGDGRPAAQFRRQR